MFEIAISAGPLIVTCMLPFRPGPNKSTVAVVPWGIVAPVFEALLPVPRFSAFGVGLDAGEATTMSTPEVVCPPEILTMMAWPTAPPPPPPPPPPPVVVPPLLVPEQPVNSNREKKRGRQSAYHAFDFTTSSPSLRDVFLRFDAAMLDGVAALEPM